MKIPLEIIKHLNWYHLISVKDGEVLNKNHYCNIFLLKFKKKIELNVTH
jgi:hypothetical protein